MLIKSFLGRKIDLIQMIIVWTNLDFYAFPTKVGWNTPFFVFYCARVIERKTRMIIVHRSVDGNLAWTCREHVVHMWCTCGAHVVHIWWACGEHVVDMGWKCGEHVVNMWWTCGEHVVNMWWTCGEHVVNMCWTCDEHVVNMWWRGGESPSISYDYTLCSA